MFSHVVSFVSLVLAFSKLVPDGFQTSSRRVQTSSRRVDGSQTGSEGIHLLSCAFRGPRTSSTSSSRVQMGFAFFQCPCRGSRTLPDEMQMGCDGCSLFPCGLGCSRFASNKFQTGSTRVSVIVLVTRGSKRGESFCFRIVSWCCFSRFHCA